VRVDGTTHLEARSPRLFHRPARGERLTLTGEQFLKIKQDRQRNDKRVVVPWSYKRVVLEIVGESESFVGGRLAA
jgi:hypothetical protein